MKFVGSQINISSTLFIRFLNSSIGRAVDLKAHYRGFEFAFFLSLFVLFNIFLPNLALFQIRKLSIVQFRTKSQIIAIVGSTVHSSADPRLYITMVWSTVVKF